MRERPITEAEIAAHNRDQDRRRYAGYLSVQKAARIVQVTPQAISYAIRSGKLRAQKQPGLRGRYWIALQDLEELYPNDRRRKAGRPKLTALSQEEAREFLGIDNT